MARRLGGYSLVAALALGALALASCDGNGQEVRPPGPALWQGVVAIKRSTSPATPDVLNVVGYATTDPANDHQAWWLVTSAFSVPIQVQPGEKVQFEHLEDMPIPWQELCERYKTQLASPILWQVENGAVQASQQCQ